MSISTSSSDRIRKVSELITRHLVEIFRLRRGFCFQVTRYHQHGIRRDACKMVGASHWHAGLVQCVKVGMAPARGPSAKAESQMELSLKRQIPNPPPCIRMLGRCLALNLNLPDLNHVRRPLWRSSLEAASTFSSAQYADLESTIDSDPARHLPI